MLLKLILSTSFPQILHAKMGFHPPYPSEFTNWPWTVVSYSSDFSHITLGCSTSMSNTTKAGRFKWWICPSGSQHGAGCIYSLCIAWLGAPLGTPVVLWALILWAYLVPVRESWFWGASRLLSTRGIGEGLCTDVALDCEQPYFQTLAIVLFPNIDSSSSRLTSILPYKVLFTFTLWC